jgi:hypothetical protein
MPHEGRGLHCRGRQRGFILPSHSLFITHSFWDGPFFEEIHDVIFPQQQVRVFSDHDPTVTGGSSSSSRRQGRQGHKEQQVMEEC